MAVAFVAFSFEQIKQECIIELSRFAKLKTRLTQYEETLSPADKEELFFTRDTEIFETFKRIRNAKTNKLGEFPIRLLFMYFDRLLYFITSVEPVPGRSEGFLLAQKRILLNDPVLYALYFVETAERNS